jgi:hypothetical protein
MRYLVGFICVLVLGLMGCSEQCTVPLDEFGLCSNSGGCPTYEEAAEIPSASTGTCLDLQYVFIGGLSARTLFFDMTGTLTAAQVITDDGSFCGGSSYIKSYGPVPSCDAGECGRFWCEEGHWLRP